MRVICAFFVLWHVRQATFEIARADMLMDGADAAHERARARLALANRYSIHAGFGPIPAHTR